MGVWGKGLLCAASGLADRLRLFGVGDVHEVDRLGCTPLHVASEKGDVKRVALLLRSRGASDVLNATDERGTTALHRASGFGHAEVVSVLLGAEGIDESLRMTDGDGRTPLHKACGYGRTEVVELLLRTGKVDVNALDGRGRTALHYAALNGHVDVVALLLAMPEIDVNRVDAKGLTALHWACRAGFRAMDVAAALLADVRVHMNVKNLEGRTPLDEAENPMTDGFGTFYVEGEMHRRRVMLDKRISEAFRAAKRHRTALALWTLKHTTLAPKEVHTHVVMLCIP